MKIVGGGDIKPRSYFQSVKDAVSLFDETASFGVGVATKEEKLSESSMKLLVLKSMVIPDGIPPKKKLQIGLALEADEEWLASAKADDSQDINGSSRNLPQERTSLKSLMDSLSRDFENLKGEHCKLKSMEIEAKQIISNLQSRLRNKAYFDPVIISEEELESLHRKVKESSALQEKKIADAMAQLENLRMREGKALDKLEVAKKELESMKLAREAAIKRAKLAETAKGAVEEELRKCCQKEREEAVPIHASAWADGTENLPEREHCHELLRARKKMNRKCIRDSETVSRPAWRN